MAERRTNIGQFNEARHLAQQVATLTAERDILTKERENKQTQMLEAHTQQLGDITNQLTLVVERTKDLPELAGRVSKLESWKTFVAGIAASFTMIGGCIGWVVSIFANGK